MIVTGIDVRTDVAGRFSLNDLHRAAGGEKRHGPSYWMALDQTKALIAELETTGKPVDTVEGRGGGTFVARELVYAYAMWISPAFNLKVIRAYDAAQAPSTAAALNDPATLRTLLLNYAGRVETLEAEVAAAKPDVLALQQLAKAEGSLCLRDSAKACGMPEQKFLQLLHESGWIYRRPGTGTWFGYSAQVQRGRLTHKVFAHEVPEHDGTKGTRIREQVRITSKGLVDAARLIKGAAPTSSPTAAAVARDRIEQVFAGAGA